MVTPGLELGYSSVYSSASSLPRTRVQLEGDLQGAAAAAGRTAGHRLLQQVRSASAGQCNDASVPTADTTQALLAGRPPMGALVIPSSQRPSRKWPKAGSPCYTHTNKQQWYMPCSSHVQRNE
jgi:hypothetical protein